MCGFVLNNFEGSESKGALFCECSVGGGGEWYGFISQKNFSQQIIKLRNKK